MIISGETLRMLRNIRGLKQETLAKKLGISQPAYSKLEKSDHINNGKLHEIIGAMGFSVQELQTLLKNLPKK